MTRRLAGMAMLVMALGVPRAFAQAPSPHPGMSGDIDHVAHVLMMLDLSNDQRQQIHALLMQAVNEDAQAPGIQTAEQQLHAAVLADVPDTQAIETITGTLNAAHAAQLDRHVALMLKVAQVLTPDQRQQLLKMHPPEPRETK